MHIKSLHIIIIIITADLLLTFQHKLKHNQFQQSYPDAVL